MKKFLAFFLVLALLLPCLSVMAEEDIVIDRIAGEGADFAFAEDAQLLEIYFPKIGGCDAAFVRYGDYSMLIDCAGNLWREVETLLKKLNVTELDYAVNSHPDADHIGGFNHILKNIPAGEFVLGFPEDYDEGGLRGALSGAINANFPDMIIATGKLNDVVFIEEIVE